MARCRRGGGGGFRKVTPTKPLPNLVWDPEGTRVLNLTVLRRLDPAVTDILITTAHVAIYAFDEGILEWSRKHVEGPLFVVKRNTQPRFQLVVMNRINTENLVEDLVTDFEYQVEVPFVIYRNAVDAIIGIWFYNPRECEEVAHLFSRIYHAFSRASPRENNSCRSVFEELEGASRPSLVSTAENTLEQPTSPIMVADDVEEFLFTGSQVSPCVDGTVDGKGVVRPNQSLRNVSSSGVESYSPCALQSSALHHLLPSRTSSVTMRPFDAHSPHSSATIQSARPASMAPTRTTMVNASSSLSTDPPLLFPIISHQPQNAPLDHPFPMPTVFPTPPYGMPLLQPFPPPSPLPLLSPTATYGTAVTREQVRAALLRLAQNDNFIDIIYREVVKRPW